MTMQKQEPTIAQQNGILYQVRQKYGVVCDSDSYKLTHAPQYPDDADMMVSYFESRGGARDAIVWWGIRMLIKEYMLQRLTREQADNMIKWATEHMNGNMVDDLKIALDVVVNELSGRLPIRIRAAKEGLVIPIKNVLFTIETTIPDKRIFSLVSYFETKLVRVWSPTTVATTSYYVRQVIMDALEKSADDPEAETAFKFHDFGSRGVGGMEVAAFAGSGHLISFMGTDTQVAVQAIEIAYGDRMTGFSIPASEHSTTTTHGRYGEAKLVSNMFDAYGKPGALFATVIDSYDALNFVRSIAPQFKERLTASDMLAWVFRPDSGDPIKMPVQIVIELDAIFGSTVNDKGYKVLNGVRVIQGDGITPSQVAEILEALMAAGYSASNMAYGMGGGLLQKNNRDTHKFALKCCAVRVNGEWIDIFKDPSEYDEDWNRIEQQSFKSSKAGRQELVSKDGEYKTIKFEDLEAYVNDGWEMELVTFFEDGYEYNECSFAEVRRRAGTFA